MECMFSALNIVMENIGNRLNFCRGEALLTQTYVQHEVVNVCC